MLAVGQVGVLSAMTDLRQACKFDGPEESSAARSANLRPGGKQLNASEIRVPRRSQLCPL